MEVFQFRSSAIGRVLRPLRILLTFDTKLQVLARSNPPSALGVIHVNAGFAGKAEDWLSLAKGPNVCTYAGAPVVLAAEPKP